MRKKLLTLCMAAAFILNSSVSASAASTGLDPEQYYYEHPDEHPANDAVSSDTSETDSLSGLSSVTKGRKKAMQTKSTYTNKTYTHNDRYEGMTISNGIDVSYYNNSVNWTKVKAAGIDYAIIRVGYRGYGKAGKLCNDVKFTENIEGAIAAGLKVGVYFFTEAINKTEAKEEAEFCIEKLEPYREHITMPVVIDYEYPPTGNGYEGGRMYDAKLSKSDATKNVKKFCKTITEANYTPMIYANGNDLQKLINGATLEKTYKIWLANYTTKTSYTGLYEHWQYASKGKVSGISGNVDCNFWYTSETTSEPVEPEEPVKISIADAVFSSITPLTYTGKAQKPAVTLALGENTLIEGTDYKLTYLNNTESGISTIKATGTGTYTDSASCTFVINPPKVTSFRKKSGTKSIKLAWDKADSITGYKIYRKDTVSGTKYTIVKTIKNPDTTVWYNTGLAADREYYYAIRTYKTVGDKTYYSSYYYLTAATLPSGKTATLKVKKKLYEQPDTTKTSVITIPKNASVTYLGKTYITSTETMLHVKYKTDKKTYNGYLITSNILKYS